MTSHASGLFRPGRFDRWILLAGWLATAGALVTAVSAAGGSDLRADGIGLHLQLATVSAMGMLLPHLWTAVYLWRLRAGGLARREELTGGLTVAALAALAVCALMATGAAAYGGRLAEWHRLATWVALTTHAGALWWEGRVLAANRRRLVG